MFRYRPDLDLAVRHLSFSISPGEKLGVCGRTGAGKSSLVKALFRVVEAAEGRILIDGVDISSMGLQKLRSSLAVVPQEPTVLDGSVRQNLDPVNERTDEDLWRVLQKSGLKERIQQLNGGLEAEMGEGGSALSAGQRQLLCVARALLQAETARACILDEATSSVDRETDAMVQKVIAEGFEDRTIVTVAHRLDTLADCDRILVMKDGALAEIGKPEELLADPRSEFRAMAEVAGVVDLFKK